MARGGGEPARDLAPGGGERLYWHPDRQVQVVYSLAGSSPTVDLDGLHALAKIVADQVARLARAWPTPFGELGLRREMREHGGFRLANATHLGMSKDGVTTELSYRTETKTIRVGGADKHTSRGFKISVRWMPAGQQPADGDTSRWSYRALPEDPELYRSIRTVLHSPTHYVRVELRGEHHGVSGYDDHFADDRHWETAMEQVRALMPIFEQRLAQPRDHDATRVARDDELNPVRPKEQASSNRASGTIVATGSGLRVLRGGRRVNLSAGGRVQQGDVIFTAVGTGTVVIRFDDPQAGQGTAGTLEIAPGSRVTIDVGPYRAKERAQPTRLRIAEGAIRFARPHDHRNPRVELATPDDVAIFGLTGTDAVLQLVEQGWVLALRDGMGDLALHGKHAKVLVPYESHLIARDGTYVGTYTFDEANYRQSASQAGLASAAPTREDDLLEDLWWGDDVPEAAEGPVPAAPDDPETPAQRIEVMTGILLSRASSAAAAARREVEDATKGWAWSAQEAHEIALRDADAVQDYWELLMLMVPAEEGMTPEQVAQRELPEAYEAVLAARRLAEALRAMGR
jgi:hypothetical protein